MRVVSRRFTVHVTALVLAVVILNVFLALPDRRLRYREAEDASGPSGGAQQDRKRTGAAEYWAWRRASLVDENGLIPDGALLAAHAHIRTMRATQRTAPTLAGIESGTWTSIGPGNIGGRVRSIAIHPTMPGTMFAGSVSGGIWRTDNAGASWAPVQDFMANLAVTSIVFTPGNAAVLYAATGEGFFNADAVRGAGVFKSTDGGATWIALAATSTAPGPGMTAADFYYTTRVAMSANGATLVAISRAGIFRSLDGGTTFADVTPPSASSRGFGDVDFHPTEPTRAVAGGLSPGGVLYSTTGGLTWAPASGIPTVGMFPQGRVELAYARSAPDTVYALVDRNSGELYRSIDGGESYTLVSTPGFLSGQGWYDNALWVNPVDPTMIVGGGIDLWRSVNSGSTFTRISRWQAWPTSAHADQHAIVEHPDFNGSTNSQVFFGNDGGVYRVDDVAAVSEVTGWQELNNQLAITQFYGGAGHAGSGRVVGGTQDNGHLFYDPAGGTPSESWVDTFGGDGGWAAYDPTNANLFFGEYIYLQLHRTSGTPGPFSSRWIARNGDQNGLLDSGIASRAAFIAPFVLDPNAPSRMLAGGVSLWRAPNVSDGVPTFEEIRDELGTGGANLISAIAVAPSNSDIVFVGDSSGRVFKTIGATADAATVRASWTTIDDNGAANPLPNRQIQRIAVDPFDPGIVYVALGGFSSNNLWRSVNGGVSWSPISADLPAVPVRDIDPHPTQPNWLYAATEVGVFASENGGATWQLPHDGPANVSVDELFFLDTTLVAATHGRGMFSAQTTGAPEAADDLYTTAFNTPLSIPAPGVLANDGSRGGGAMRAVLVSPASSGTLTLGENGSFVYLPNHDFHGTDAFTYRAASALGQSDVATVAITVMPLPTTAQPPTNLYTWSIIGNTVTLRWTPPLHSLPPTSFVVEGGVLPGQVLASLPTASAQPTHTFTAPTGAFYVRVHTVSGTVRSAASNEIRLFVRSAMPPSEPANLLGVVNGANLALTWRNTFRGGAPSYVLLNVAGTRNATIRLGAMESFSFAGVPPGSYTLSVRAGNGSGLSGPSNTVALTFPAPCSGVPLAPANVMVTSAGRRITVVWDSPETGPAPTGYVVNVSGSFAGRFPVSARSIAGTVPPGTYTLGVLGTNPCGAGVAGPTQTMLIR